jgi:hypothetical protein
LPSNESADEILERDWARLCCTAAIRWAKEAENQDRIVVHGTVLNDKAEKRIDHVWCKRAIWS